MTNEEIKVNPGVVRGHANEIRSSNSHLASKAKSSVSEGTTNFEGYTMAIPCSNSITEVLSKLTNKIETDCDNLISAADAVCKIDKQIAGTFSKGKERTK